MKKDTSYMFFFNRTFDAVYGFTDTGSLHKL